MNDTSDTSSNLDNVNYINNNVEVKSPIKRATTETDLYLNMVVNTNKVKEEEEQSTSSLKLDDDIDNNTSINSSSQNSVSSKVNFENVNLKTINNDSITSNNSNRSNRSDRTIKSIRSNKSNNSTNSNNTPVEDYQFNKTDIDSERSKSPIKLNSQQIRMKKIELLRKLSELKQKGYKLSKEYDFNSEIEDMEYEFELLKSFANKRNGIKLYKNVLLNVCSVSEFLNDKYDPFSFQLNGWSEHMSVEVDNYDDVLEELYEKYKGSGGKMAPELKLLLLILASASAFHFSKAHLANIPGLDKVLQKNPDMISKLVSGKNKSSQFMTEQEINIEKQKTELQQKEREFKQQMREQQEKNIRIQNLLKENKELNERANTNNNMFQNNISPMNLKPPVNSNNNEEKIVPKIVKNENVESILARLHSRNNSDTETQDEVSNNDRIVSDTTETRKKKKKKAMMKIH